MKQEGKSGNRDKNPTGTILSIKYPSEPLGLRGGTAQPPTRTREENSPDLCSSSRCNEDQREEGEMWKLLASNTAEQNRKVPSATKGRAEVGLSLEIWGRKKKRNNNKKTERKEPKGIIDCRNESLIHKRKNIFRPSTCKQLSGEFLKKRQLGEGANRKKEMYERM